MTEINLESIISGKVWKIEKSTGDFVNEGECVLVVESMKMEIPVEATATGTVARISVAEGDMIVEDQVVAVIVVG